MKDLNLINQTEKKARVFRITDETFKILCQADKKKYDPTVGLENIVSMYKALHGPINIPSLELARAAMKAQELLVKGPTFEVDGCEK